MKTKEVIAQINENGGLDIDYCRHAARADKTTLYNYVKSYIKNYYSCSDYIAGKAADYFIK